MRPTIARGKCLSVAGIKIRFVSRRPFEFSGEISVRRCMGFHGFSQTDTLSAIDLKIPLSRPDRQPCRRITIRNSRAVTM